MSFLDDISSRMSTEASDRTLKCRTCRQRFRVSFDVIQKALEKGTYECYKCSNRRLHVHSR